MNEIIKMSLSVIKDELSISEMEDIQAGSGAVSSFCTGFAAASGIYGLGCLLNLWNPCGIVGGVAIGAIDTDALFSYAK